MERHPRVEKSTCEAAYVQKGEGIVINLRTCIGEMYGRTIVDGATVNK